MIDFRITARDLMTSGALRAGASPSAPPRHHIDPGKQDLAGSLSRQAPRPVHDLSWVRGPVWDSFWMLSALWLAPFAWWLALGHSDPESSPLDLLYFGQRFVLDRPSALQYISRLLHRGVSTAPAYATAALRRPPDPRHGRLLRSFSPGGFGAAVDARATRHCFGNIDYAWVTWHFASLHFGALSLYRARAGRAHCTQTRRLDRFFAFSIGGVLVFVADILAGTVAYQGHWIGRAPFADWVVDTQDGIRNVATAALLFATVVILFLELRGACWSFLESCTWLAWRSWWAWRCVREVCFSFSLFGLHNIGSSPRVLPLKRLTKNQRRASARSGVPYTS